MLVDRALVAYRRHSGNASANRVRDIRTARRVWATAYHSPDNSREDAALLTSVWRRHQRRTAVRKVAQGRAMLRPRHLVAGLGRIADGMAHRLLRRPPRIWRRPVPGSSRPATQTTIAIRRGPLGARSDRPRDIRETASDTGS